MTELESTMYVNASAQEATIVLLKEDQANNQLLINKLQKELEESNKVGLTPSQMDEIHDEIAEAMEDFDFSDVDNYNFEFDIDWSNHICVNSMQIDDLSGITSKIWSRVCKLFKEIE